MSDDENPPPEGGTALENLSSEKKKESGPVDDASAVENGDLNEDFKTSPDENKSPSDNSSRTRKLSAPQPQSRVRKSSIIKNSTSERSERSRKYSEGNIHSSRQRKISFLNSDALVPPPEDEPRRPVEDACTDSDSLSAPLTSRLHMSMGDDEEYNDRFSNLEKRESLAFLQVVQERLTPKASCASLAYRGSRASFSTLGASTGGVNMASRPSMVSLKETLSRVNLELHPEKGSFVAFSMGQSMASIPTIAAKVYIITQVRFKKTF
ncbi:hypothetical protein FHG87_006100 [Trinorchestia longiramus]|nr:hypothetical protein FHG87_006100 [Trinorchestia longiramus]